MTAQEGFMREWERFEKGDQGKRQAEPVSLGEEMIDDLMRKAGMDEIADADYRYDRGEEMTVCEQESLDVARKFARLVIAASKETQATPQKEAGISASKDSAKGGKP